MKISEIINNYMSTRESIEEQSKKMKVLITGSNGYLGARISQYLSLSGFEISSIISASKVELHLPISL